MILINDDAFFRSGLFVCNLSGFKCSWWLAHTWSLSVEEQFYICWPLAFVLLGRAQGPAIVCIFICLAIGSYEFHDLSSFAHIAIGALFAISKNARNWITKIATTPVILFAGSLILLRALAFPLPVVAKGLLALEPVLVAVVFFGTVFNNRGGPIRQIVSNGLLAKIGLVSYSLYLWQQISLAPRVWGEGATGAIELYRIFPALMFVAFIPAAIISYHLIERPFVRLGHRVSREILEQKYPQN